MRFDVSKEGSVVLVAPLESRLDAQCAAAFKESLLRLVDAGERQLVLDLARVDFLDSSGLGVLVALLKRLGFHGALVVCGAHGAVAALFRATRMDRVIKLVTTRQKALALVCAGALED